MDKLEKINFININIIGEYLNELILDRYLSTVSQAQSVLADFVKTSNNTDYKKDRVLVPAMELTHYLNSIRRPEVEMGVTLLKLAIKDTQYKL